ncbi:MAG: cupin domain-containing protein [Pseudomonadota bacterium]
MSNEKYVVRRNEIEAMEGYAKTHFLNDNARRVNKSLGDLTGLTGLGFHLIEVQPGRQSTELHTHHHEDECVYVLDGEADARIGDEVVRVRAGDFIGYRAGGLPHTLTNPGPGVLRCIVAGQRLPHDTADYPEAGKRLYRNEGLRWNLVDRDAITEVDAGRKR